MKKWMTSKYTDTIEEVEVMRETEHFVTVKKGLRERVVRERKYSGYQKYHDSWEDARNYMLAQAEWQVAHHRRMLDKSEAEVAKILEMTPPEVTA